MTLIYSIIILIKYFKDAFLTMRQVVSLNFVIVRHVGVISHQERPLQKSYQVDFMAHHVQGLTCILQDLWKLSKVGIYFKTSHDAFNSYSCHWNLWLLGYRFHGSISSIIWFLVHISRSRLCFKMDRQFQVETMITKQW